MLGTTIILASLALCSYSLIIPGIKAIALLLHADPTALPLDALPKDFAPFPEEQSCDAREVKEVSEDKSTSGDTVVLIIVGLTVMFVIVGWGC